MRSVLPYGVLADIHANLWSSFASVTADGINTRLQIILDEFERAADEIIAAGGSMMVIAGDVFHVRGSIDPEVLNPFQAALRRVLDKSLDVYILPGNHDLKSKETTFLGNSIHTLGETFSSEGNCIIVTEPDVIYPTGNPDDGGFAFVPWTTSNDELLGTLAQLAKRCQDPSKVDAFIHAGIDGVLSGMPDHGLTSAKLAAIGFRRVFAGHYHHHKDFQDGVFSVGALTHQTWSDIDTKAGFLIVSDEVRYHASHAPNFIEITPTMDEADLMMVCPDNYVRVRGGSMTDADINTLRDELTAMGAIGISIQVVRETVSARGSQPAKKAATVDESVDRFIDEKAIADAEAVKKGCADVLTHVRSLAA